MSSTIPTVQFNLKPVYLHYTLPNTHTEVTSTTVVSTRNRGGGGRRKRPSYSSFNSTLFHLESNHAIFCKPNSVSSRTVFTRVSNGGGGAASQQKSSNTEKTNQSSPAFGDSYVALFVRMLGLDNDPLDREQAIVGLWKYSLGGKKCIDNILQFHGCINLTISLLKSDSDSAHEAAAGLLRSISSIDLYRDVVAESGAIEEISSLLSQSSLTSEVKEQSICTLWNLSIEEKHRVKIANSDILPLLIKSLEEDDIKVKEAAGGVLANLALTHSNHNIMVEAGVIPKLATFLKAEIEDQHKVIRKEARNALVELAKNEYYKILIIEEGLVPVPLVGTAAYRSLAPSLHSWPSFPDGTEIDRTSKIPSRFGASELLLGLNIDVNSASVEEAKMKAVIGRSKQQFLARSGAIEVEDTKSGQDEISTKQQFTLLPWVDGVARLVLILELEDETALSRAAEAIADASVNGHMRNSFKEAGAIKHLVRLLGHHSDKIQFAVIFALERLSFSNDICQIIEAEGVMQPLSNILKNSQTSDSMMEKALNLLARILDLSRETKLKYYNGSRKGLNGAELADGSTGLTASSNAMPRQKSNTIEDMLDSTFIVHLVDIMKHSSPNLQRKAAAVLEFVAISSATMDTILSADISSGLDAIFQQRLIIDENESEVEIQQPELLALQAEEAGLAISAASRLLTKLLDFEQFHRTINSTHFISVLRKVLKSKIPLDYKDWVAACLVKLGSLYGPSQGFENPINMEVILYETIPRLIEQIRSSLSVEAQEAAVMELNRIISKGVIDATRAVASQGAIYPLIGLLEGGNERVVEAALSILYNLSMDEENHPAILAAGAVPALTRIIRSQRPQWKRALHLLRALPT